MNINMKKVSMKISIKLNYETRAALPMTKEDVIKHEIDNDNELSLVRDQTLNRDAY